MPTKNENGSYIDAIIEPLPEITYDTEMPGAEREADEMFKSIELTLKAKIPSRLRRELRWAKIKARMRMWFCHHDYEWWSLGPENEVHICRKCGKITAMRYLVQVEGRG